MGVRRQSSAAPTASKRRSCRGVSLVETLVAMGVFAVGLLTLMPMTVATLRSNDLAASRTRAVSLAQAKLEDFRCLPYDEAAGLAAGREVLPDGYVRQWGPTDTPAVPGDGNDLRRLWVKVSWGSSSPGSVSLVASRSRY